MYYNAGLSSKNAMLLYQMGWLYYNGITEKELGKDAHKAYAHLERSFAISQQGCTAGLLGCLTLAGEGTTENPQKAIEYLETGCRLGDYGSFMLLAECYKNGWGVTKDVKKAEDLEKEAKSTGMMSSAILTQMFLNSML